MTDEDRREPPGADSNELLLELRSALPDSPESTSTSIFYGFGLLGAALGGAFVVFCYLGLAALVLLLSTRFAAELLAPWFVGQATSWGQLSLGLLVVAFAAAFCVAWIKPLLRTRAKAGQSLRLLPETESLFFEWVHETARLTGAPAPESIVLDAKVGAGAGFRGGFRGVLRGRLVLTLGLPLVHGLDAAQLAGVLAHELGHFRQGLGLRLGTVTRWVVDFAERAARDRDQLDERLGRWLRSPNPLVWMPTAVVLGLSWCLRRFLAASVIVGHAAGAFAARQMERDADLVAGSWVGSMVWSSVLAEIPRLELAERRALATLDAFVHEKALPADLPALIGLQRQRLEGEVLERLDRALDRPSRDFFATHPSERERIRAVRSLADTEGRFQLGGKAKRWFHGLDALGAEVSETFYRQRFGTPSEEMERLATEELIDRQTGLSSEAAALGRFFGETLNMVRCLPLEPSSSVKGLSVPSTSGHGREEQLVRRQQVLSESAGLEKDLETVSELWGERLLVLQAGALVEAGVPFDGRLFGLPKDAVAAVPVRLADLERRLDDVGRRLPEREMTSAARFLGALELLDHAAMAKTLPQADAWRREVPRLLRVARLLSHQFPNFHRLVEGQSVLTSLVPYGHLFGTQPALAALVQQVLSDLEEALSELVDGVGDETYPFTHSLGSLSLKQHFVSQDLEDLDPFVLFELAKTAVHRGYDLYLRVLGRLAMIAEAIEDEILDAV